MSEILWRLYSVLLYVFAFTVYAALACSGIALLAYVFFGFSTTDEILYPMLDKAYDVERGANRD